MPAPAFVQIKLPMPPSANNLFANVPGKGRVKTKAYRLWITQAGWELKAQRPASVAGPVNLSIVVQRRKSPRADLDNCLKGLIDLVVKHGVIVDDSLIEQLFIRWAVEGDGALILIEPALAKTGAAA